jgi:hypothetical protein
MAYESAKERLSINKLLATVKRLDFIYPYHQAIGFYLEKVGYTKSQLEPFKKLGIDMDFYLAHDMKSRDFATEWRVYHPVGM